MVGDLLDVVTILENLRVRNSGLGQNLQRGLLPSTELLNFHIMQPIAFSLELRDRNVQFLSTHTDMKLCTEPHINEAFLSNLIFEHVRGGLKDVSLVLLSWCQQRTNRGFRNTHPLANGNVGVALFLEPLSLVDLRLLDGILCDRLRLTEFRGVHAETAHDFLVRQAFFLELVDLAQEVTTLRFDVATRTPRIAT